MPAALWRAGLMQQGQHDGWGRLLECPFHPDALHSIRAGPAKGRLGTPPRTSGDGWALCGSRYGPYLLCTQLNLAPSSPPPSRGRIWPQPLSQPPKEKAVWRTWHQTDVQLAVPQSSFNTVWGGAKDPPKGTYGGRGSSQWYQVGWAPAPIISRGVC